MRVLMDYCGDGGVLTGEGGDVDRSAGDTVTVDEGTAKALEQSGRATVDAAGTDANVPGTVLAAEAASRGQALVKVGMLRGRAVAAYADLKAGDVVDVPADLAGQWKAAGLAVDAVPVTLTATATGGTVDPDTASTWVTPGTVLTFTVEASAGCTAAVTANGAAVTLDEQGEFAYRVESGLAVVVVFGTTVTISVDGGGGAMSPTGEQVVECGGELAVTITPTEGMVLDTLTLDSVDVKGDVVDGVYTVAVADAPLALVAAFATE